MFFIRGSFVCRDINVKVSGTTSSEGIAVLQEQLRG